MLRFLIASALFLGQLSMSAQEVYAYMLMLHGAGCDDQSGVLVAIGMGGNGSYTYLWDDGSTNDTLSGVGAGVHGVTIYSAGDSATATVDLHGFGIDTVIVHSICGGDLGGPGWIQLDDIHAQYPLQFAWYDGDGDLMQDDGDLLTSEVPGEFHYAVTDADGCVDSGSVYLAASDPVLEVFASDSVLCYGQSALMWYTPGFTLYDDWGQMYDSSTDTIYYTNQMGSVNSFPSIGVDAYGCEAEIGNNPFVYQQSHPDAVPLFHHEDTISTTYVIDLQPSATYTYIWYFNGQVIDTSVYSYLPIDTSGVYGVSIINQYGCSVFGTIEGNVSHTGLVEVVDAGLNIGPNPAVGGEPWWVMVPDLLSTLPYRIIDASGRPVLVGSFNIGRNGIGAELPAGSYLLEADGVIVPLMRTR